MPIPQERVYTVNDIYDLPEGMRAELINGKIYYMAPPTRTHQKLVSIFNQIIANHIDSNHGMCEVYPAPFAVFLDESSINYVEPDISVICDPDKLDEKGCHGAPDWIIEIVSPGSRMMDYHVKLFKYCNAGVTEYWVVDPEKKRITVHNFLRETTEEYGLYDSVPVGIYDNFSIKLNM